MFRALARFLGQPVLLATCGLVTCGLAACGQNAAKPDDAAAGDDAFVTCETDTRAMPYRPGMTVDSSATPPLFRLKLVESVPGPPTKGISTWTVEVDDFATEAPLDNLELAVMPYMPDHQHGTKPVVVTPVNDAPGTYTLSPVNLFMSGVWQVRFTIVGAQIAGGITDTAVIPICIP